MQNEIKLHQMNRTIVILSITSLIALLSAPPVLAKETACGPSRG